MERACAKEASMKKQYSMPLIEVAQFENGSPIMDFEIVRGSAAGTATPTFTNPEEVF